MRLGIAKMFSRLPISLKILAGFLAVSCALTAASGILYYRHAKAVVEDSLRRQASALCEHAEREFAWRYAAPIEQELRILVTSPQLNNYLMSSKEEMLLPRAEVEQLFLHLSPGGDIHLATTFLDASGQEKIATQGNLRKRALRTAAQIAQDGLLGVNTNRVFAALKADGASALACSEVFRDAHEKLGVLVGVAVPEPEAGGFGGVVLQHCDLSGFLRDVSYRRILGTAVMWVLGSDGDVLSSPPESELRQDPRPYLAGARAATDGYVYPAACRLFPAGTPVMTVVCSIPRPLIARELRPVIRSVLVIFSVLLGGSGACSFLISRWISRRIRRLTKAAQNVSVENRDMEWEPRLTESTDEIGVLAQAFRTMVLGLKKSTTSIDNLNREIAQRQQVEEALRRERDRAQGYLDVADVMLLALNEQGHIALINRKGRHILGQEEQELLGQDWFETCLPSHARPHAQEVFRLLLGGEIDSVKYIENPVLTPSGAERILAWHNTILRDDTGRIVGTLSSGEDITERRRMEEELRGSEERFRQQTGLLKNVLSHVPHFVFWKDRNLVYLGCNDAFAQSAGVGDADHIVGKTDYDLVWQKEAEFYRQCDRQVMDSGEPLLNFEEPQTREDGRQITLLTSKVPLRDASGRVIGILGIYADITDRKRAAAALEKSEEQYRSLFENMLNGFASCEMLFENGRPQDFLYLKVNNAFERLTGLKNVVGRRVTEVIPGIRESNPEMFEIYGRVALTGQPESFETFLNGIGWLSISAHSPKQGHFVAVFENITERKQAEEQQSQLLQRLSDINQELKDFAYVVSHDLKAPLRAIKTLAEWLSVDYQDKLDEQGKENLRLLGSRVDRMQSLIDGVLQYSRIGRTEQGTAPVNLERLLPEIIENLGAPEHISIRIESGLPTVEGDTTRITQLFQNLLSNAIKYMDKPQGRIRVACAAEGAFWKFRVSDNGPGIAPKDFERIFKLFQTLTRRDDRESTGVGLTIAKKIVEMYGGRIWVESEVGQGSTFFFTFPQATQKRLEEPLQACAAGLEV